MISRVSIKLQIRSICRIGQLSFSCQKSAKKDTEMVFMTPTAFQPNIGAPSRFPGKGKFEGDIVLCI